MTSQNILSGFADNLPQSQWSMVSIYQRRSQTPQDAPLRHALKTLTQTVSIPVPSHGLLPYWFMTECWTGPDGLKGPFDSSGSPVGCKSDCEVDPNPSNSSSCCTGSYNTPTTCPNSGVPHYSYFSTSFPFPCVDMPCNAVFHRVEVPQFERVCV